jgi:hypothetical protein
MERPAVGPVVTLGQTSSPRDNGQQRCGKRSRRDLRVHAITAASGVAVRAAAFDPLREPGRRRRAYRFDPIVSNEPASTRLLLLAMSGAPEALGSAPLVAGCRARANGAKSRPCICKPRSSARQAQRRAALLIRWSAPCARFWSRLRAAVRSRVPQRRHCRSREAPPSGVCCRALPSAHRETAGLCADRGVWTSKRVRTRTIARVPLREPAERRPALSHSRRAALSCRSAPLTR